MTKHKAVPTIDQVEHVLSVMPADTIVQRRDRALIAFTMLTGTRVMALISLHLGHVDVAGGYVDQDARSVRTKFGKTFRTYFMPVSEQALDIVGAWHAELSADITRGPDDPIFPATAVALGPGDAFIAAGLQREGWSTSAPVRAVFRRAFALAGLPYYNPHSFRDMLVRRAMTLNLTPEAMKAWSQNLGHADVLTTFTSYGAVPSSRQGDLVRSANAMPDPAAGSDIAVMERVLATMKAGAHQPA